MNSLSFGKAGSNIYRMMPPDGEVCGLGLSTRVVGKRPTSPLLLSSLHFPKSILYHTASAPSIDMTTINIDMESTSVLPGFLLLLTGIVFAFEVAQNNTRSCLAVSSFRPHSAGA